MITEGWRFWIVRPGEDVLRVPYRPGAYWPARVEHARCREHPEHRPPTPECLCGVYADYTAAATVTRMRGFRDETSAWRTLFEAAGHRGAIPAYVVGQVALTGAVPSVVPWITSFDPEGELRAATAEITTLYVDDHPEVPAELLAADLRARYKVMVLTRQSQTGRTPSAERPQYGWLRSLTSSTNNTLDQP